MDGALIGGRDGWSPEALAARDVQINGGPQRIEPLAPDQLGPELEALIEEVQAPIGAYRPPVVHEYFRTVAKHPEVFACQMRMGVVLFTGRIPPQERELAILRIGWLLGAPYEWGEHVVIAKRYGMTDEAVERATLGSAAAGWTPHEAAILSGVEELLSHQALSDETWAVLAETWDEPRLIEYLAMVGQYVATAMIQNALRVRLSEDNPGLTRR